jgi:hypothetical protein
MDRIPEYVKSGFAVGATTMTSAFAYGFMTNYTVSPSLIVAAKIWLFAFPILGTGIVIKKMYDFHTAPLPAQGYQRPPRND